MLRLIVVLTFVVIVEGCATGEQMRGVREGMFKQDVIGILGHPDGFQRNGDYEALRYTNRLISGWSWDRADYNVILRNDQVVEYGPGQVRQGGPNTTTLFLVPLK